MNLNRYIGLILHGRKFRKSNYKIFRKKMFFFRENFEKFPL